MTYDEYTVLLTNLRDKKKKIQNAKVYRSRNGTREKCGYMIDATLFTNILDIFVNQQQKDVPTNLSQFVI